MKMLTDLISTDYGLMSLAAILIVIAIWIFFTVLFMGKIGKSRPQHIPPKATLASKP